MTYNDPQEVHGGECDECCGNVRDNEVDLYPFGRKMVCGECFDALEAEAEQDAREEAEEVSDKWLFIAGDITGASQ